MVDREGGGWGVAGDMHPLSVQLLLYSRSFGKILPNNRLVPPSLGLAIPVWETLDPPLF